MTNYFNQTPLKYKGNKITINLLKKGYCALLYIQLNVYSIYTKSFYLKVYIELDLWMAKDPN